MKKPPVCVVVPNWNGKQFLEACLHSLKRQTQPHRVVVVDNGSTDGSVDFVSSHFPEVELIELTKNRGFAGGVNQGIQAGLSAGAEFIALLNNDAEAHPQWLTGLLKRIFKSKTTGIVTGKLLQKGDLVDSAGEAYSIWAQPFPIGRNQKDSGQFNQAREITAASGGASLYRAAMLKQVGMFDEAFFAYYEDVDLSLRAQMMGWRVWYEPTAVAHHQVGATSSRHKSLTAYHRLKNMLFLYDKNMPTGLFWRYLPRKLISFALSWLVTVRRGQFSAAIKAPLVVLLTSPWLILKRWQTQKRRRLNSQQFDKLLFHGAPPPSRPLNRLSKIFDRKYQSREVR